MELPNESLGTEVLLGCSFGALTEQSQESELVQSLGCFVGMWEEVTE